MGATYVSPVVYKDYDCEQLATELARVNQRANELHNSLEKECNADKAQMAVGMVLFWPALFFLEGGDGPETAEYTRLKGERECIEKLLIERQCSETTL
ncbi:MAG: hypothetical protein R6U50_00715 [Desulfobacterales bacterium]